MPESPPGTVPADNGGDDTADAAVLQTDEQESYRRYQAAEREILEVLEAENVDDATRKRRMMRVFDRFRYEYTQLSLLLREHIRTQRKIMDKCLEMKNELVLAALKIKTNQHVQDEEMKNLVFYRDECEIAWKERKLSEERERDAMRIIDDLKSEIEELQTQVKALVATSTALPARGARPSALVSGTASEEISHNRNHYSSTNVASLGSPSKDVHVRGLSSPSKAAALKKQSRGFSGDTITRPSTVSSSQTVPSFDEWKHANRVWSPAQVAPRTATPTLESLYALERKQEIARCVSVPSLQPTAMEKAVAAAAVLPLSPSPTRKSRKPQTAVGFLRATTSSGGSRATTASLPHV